MFAKIHRAGSLNRASCAKSRSLNAKGPPSSMKRPMSFSAKDIVERVDTWPYFQRDPIAYKRHMKSFYYFMVEGFDHPFGYISSAVVRALEWSRSWKIDQELRTITLHSVANPEERTRAIQETLLLNREKGHVKRKPCREEFPLCDGSGELVANMDICGIDLFGVVSYGVHMTAFVRNSDGNKYWVQQRSDDKSTFPSLLDNFVAGNLTSGETPAEGMVREVFEESGISPEYTREHMKACGTVTYQMSVRNNGDEGCQHHCQYVYEMELSSDMVPYARDGEAKKFKLMSLHDVLEGLMQDKFTPNRAMTYIAHFVRHGIVNAENEPCIQEVCARLNRKHDLFMV